MTHTADEAVLLYSFHDLSSELCRVLRYIALKRDVVILSHLWTKRIKLFSQFIIVP